MSGGGGGSGAKDSGTAEKTQRTTITAMGNCGLRRVLGGAVAEGGSHPPPPNQIITGNSKKTN
jgi:hypothetical protein